MPAISQHLWRDRTPAQTVGASLALVAVVGALDHITGYEWSFSIFYLVPVAFATWYGPSKAGYFVSLLSAITWLVVDFTSGHTYSHNIIPFWNACVRFGFFVITAELLTRLRTNLEREKMRAQTDGLTGLLNAAGFRERGRQQLDLAARYGHPTAVGFIDLDNFKTVNDSLGHAEGDRVLQTVATVLGRCARATDTVGRLGGDEFVVLLPETSDADAQKMFSRIRDKLLQRASKNAWPVGFSIGVALYAETPATIDEALRVADHLMYRVKCAGKNAVLYEAASTDMA